MNYSSPLIQWARRLLRPAREKQSKLLFVFQGRQGFRAGMGRGLYASESVFRQSVDRCAAVIAGRLGVDLAAGFQNAEAAERAQGNEFHSILTHGLLHIGLAELWKWNGVEPDATIGLSLGEMTSAVAAGVLTPQEAITVVQTAAQWDERVLARGKLLLLEVDLARAGTLCRESPAKLECFAEYGPTTMVVFCAVEDVAQIASFLHDRGIKHQVHRGDYAYHTPRFATSKELVLSDLAHLRPRPAACPYYSSLAGGMLPATSHFDANYWYWMLAQPVLFNTAFEAALVDGYDVVLNIGPHPSLDSCMREAAAKLGKSLLFVDSLRDDRPEEQSFAAALDRLRGLGLATSRARPGIPPHRIAASAVNFSDPDTIRDPYPLLEAIRAQGSVHFLPRHNYWIVLGRDEVLAALRQPEVFASDPARGLDAVLLGADPEQHARARRILAPHFKPAQDPALEAEIASTADRLLDQSADAARFDLVSAFAVPVSESVAARFIGLDGAETAELLAMIGPNRWVLDYIPKLDAFFTGYADRNASRGPDTLLGRMTAGGGEPFEAAEAASILKLMWVAGTTTTGMLIASAARILLYQPDVRAEIVEHPELIPSLIEETLRLDPPELTLWRRTRGDTALAGTPIPNGAEVRLSLAAANRDPAYYEHAASFVLRRRKQANLAFGGGIHQCIGAGLARLTARVALERLIARFPRMRPEVPENRLHYAASDHFRALATLSTMLQGVDSC
jgi:cytochrome P450